MSTENTSNSLSDEIEREVRLLQGDMIGVKHILASQESILREIKDAVVAQTKTMEMVTRLKDRLQVLDEDLTRTDKKLDGVKESTDQHALESENFRGQFKGALVAASIFFTAIQVGVSWYVGKNDDNIEKLDSRVSVVENKQHGSDEKTNSTFIAIKDQLIRIEKLIDR